MSKIPWLAKPGYKPATVEWVEGCDPVSRGCANCYAKDRIWPRLYPGRPFSDVQLRPDRLADPLTWRLPRMAFPCSRSDLWHRKVPSVFQRRAFATMALADQHIFVILTKRPARMKAFFEEPETARLVEALASIWRDSDPDLRIPVKEWRWPLPNVWLGVSVEDQARANERIPLLLETPAKVRVVSYEPALEAVDFTALWEADCCFERREFGQCRCAFQGHIDWLIVGGESGRADKVRAFDPHWARLVIDQCRAADVACYVKQMGSAWASELAAAMRQPCFNLRPELVGMTEGPPDKKGEDPAYWPPGLLVREWPGG